MSDPVPGREWRFFLADMIAHQRHAQADHERDQADRSRDLSWPEIPTFLVKHTDLLDEADAVELLHRLGITFGPPPACMWPIDAPDRPEGDFFILPGETNEFGNQHLQIERRMVSGNPTLPGPLLVG
ncbi:MAG: hypothetical protein HQM02_13920 [Magnetococcales bacterium]|nr:hypothetical protein [Magnetococcales bacterium]